MAGKRKLDPENRRISKACGKRFTTGQVRILRILRAQARPVERHIIGKYSAHWLAGLWELESAGLIRIEEHEATFGKAKHLHSITKKGRDALAECERLAAVAEEAAKPQRAETETDDSKENVENSHHPLSRVRAISTGEDLPLD